MIPNINEDIENAELKIRQGCMQEMHELLYYIAKKMQPKNYLEIGVYFGRSMALVLKASPQTKGYGIDTWAPHAGLENATPAGLKGFFQKIDIHNLPVLLSGKSYDRLPIHLKKNEIPQDFQLILVDGAHHYEAAKKDLEFCFPCLSDGGILVFHDTVLHSHLADLFLTFKKKYVDFLFLESFFGQGTGIAFKPPLSEGIFCR